MVCPCIITMRVRPTTWRPSSRNTSSPKDLPRSRCGNVSARIVLVQPRRRGPRGSDASYEFGRYSRMSSNDVSKNSITLQSALQQLELLESTSCQARNLRTLAAGNGRLPITPSGGRMSFIAFAATNRTRFRPTFDTFRRCCPPTTRSEWRPSSSRRSTIVRPFNFEHAIIRPDGERRTLMAALPRDRGQ